MIEKKTRICRRILAVLILLMLCWIWGNSMMPQDVSRRISNKFKNEVRPYYHAIVDWLATPAWEGTPQPTGGTISPLSDRAAAEKSTGTEKLVAKAAPVPSPSPAKPKDVRKYAHVAEFAALGILAALFALTHASAAVQRGVNVLSFGLAVAVMDESIQILSGRGPLVTDILLDFSGYLAGAGSIALLWLLHRAAACPKHV